MPQILLSVSEPRILVLAVLCTSITAYFLSLRNKTRDLWFLIGAFSCWTAHFYLALANEVFYPLSPWYALMRMCIGLLGLVLFIGFACSFGRLSLGREGVIALSCASVLVGLSTLLLTSEVAAGHTIAWYSGSGTALILFTWSELVFIRRWLTAKGPRERCAHRSFALVFLLSLGAVAVYFLRDIGLCPAAIAPAISDILYLATLVFFTLIYVNYVPNPTTFPVKITAASLFTVLAVLTVTWTALSPVVPHRGPTVARLAAMNEYVRHGVFGTAGIQEQVISCNFCILGSTLFVLVFFPAFFHGSLVRPLNALLRAVDLLDSGRRDVQLQANANDEIGRLTDSFNRLTCSLKAAEDDIQCYTESLELKVRERTAEIGRKNEENERLLLNILPASIADRLKRGEGLIADACSEATVVFADIVGFTGLCSRVPACELVELLSGLISEFDQLAEQYGVEKIKTIGDAYMAVAGLPNPHANHAHAAVCLSLAMIKAAAKRKSIDGRSLQLRVGISTGPVVAGIIGTNKFAYDLWGDTVNTASRMESSGEPNRIQVTESTYRLLQDHFQFESRGEIFIKGKGFMCTYFLTGEECCVPSTKDRLSEIDWMSVALGERSARFLQAH